MAFAIDVTNYTNTTSLTTQKSDSPLARLTTSTQFKPILAISSQYDPMPYHQIVDLRCAFESQGVDPSLYTIKTILDSTAHAFTYWFGSVNGYPTAKPINTTVIEFLDAHLK